MRKKEKKPATAGESVSIAVAEVDEIEGRCEQGRERRGLRSHWWRIHNTAAGSAASCSNLLCSLSSYPNRTVHHT
ncbi:hypothetical protein PIB30_016176 [Stylosanthes scabra]|uniref:Uncharacterized protein n=1 Tax=Stylosanthes scabra TaxID=79078 RepID=A0ABU6U618_9FABA|nr:hypothetical protein [Stylosanthes scabra]